MPAEPMASKDWNSNFIRLALPQATVSVAFGQNF
jgi:hypothetical protein